MKSIIAGNVKKIITQKGFKQNVVAKWAGYDEKTFSNMLNGRKKITDNDIPPIAIALGVTPNDLFFGDAIIQPIVSETECKKETSLNYEEGMTFQVDQQSQGLYKPVNDAANKAVG